MRRIKKGFFLCFVLSFVLLFPMNIEAASKIKISKTKITVYMGSTESLKISGTTKKAAWSSSDKKIAVVNSKGKITPRKAGKATITAKVSGKNYTCAVIVKKPYISVKAKSMYSGNTYTLKLTGTGIKSVKTSNSKVAAINKAGKVTAKGAGKAVITLTGKDNKSYKCVLTIKKPFINASKKSLEVGKTYTLKLTGTSIVSASTSNKNVAAVSSKGKITAKKTGKATITLKGKNGTKYKCGVTVTHKHTYVSTVTKKADCTRTGIRFYQCSCGKYYEKTIAKLPHNWKYNRISYNEKADKYISYYQCSMCRGEKEQYDKVCKHTNSVNRGIEAPASCVTEGIINCQCRVCTKRWVEKIPKKNHSFIQEIDSDAGQIFKCNTCVAVSFHCSSNNTALTKLTENRIVILPEGFVILDFQKELLSGDKWKKLSLRNSNQDIIYPVEELTAEGAFRIRGKKAGTTDLTISYDGVELTQIKITVGRTYEEAVRQYYNGNTNVLDGHTEEAQAVVTGAAGILKETVTASMTDAQKVTALADWFHTNIMDTGVDDYEASNSELYYVLAANAHIGNRPAQVKAFSLLLNALQIPNYAIGGSYGPASLGWSRSDMWMAVCLDIGNGKGVQWYYVDPVREGLITDMTVEEYNGVYGRGVFEITSDIQIGTPEEMTNRLRYQAENSKKMGQTEYVSTDEMTAKEFPLVH